jgi:hypothetical protein
MAGGLSSYCLFLMVTRYLQEQSSLDVGSLLMGFLDFFGNHVSGKTRNCCSSHSLAQFDYAATGISVRHRQVS